ncbi:MAG: metal ABC transporter permease [Verrucomicrobia bacterium]|nr:metal ABC transporter permease [Verrucomicrobiota bacterium]
MTAQRQSRGSPSFGLLVALVGVLAFIALTVCAESATPALWRIFSLRDYNTRVVMGGTGLLGVACGVIGTFMVLRKKALLGDAISHATLPGIAIAFLVMVAAGGTGKYLPGLLLGAAVSGVLGMGAILLVRHHTRLPEDAILGIVLSIFFGAGVAILGVIQKMSTASAAGLETFIYGKTASMLGEDGRRIAWAAGVLIAISVLLFKEFRALCFDAGFARAQGWPIRTLDAVMMGMVVTATVIGLQAVGLILVIALLIIPPSAARFWTEDLGILVWLAAGLGALSGVVGSGVSAAFPELPAGGVIVLVASSVFVVSLLFGRARGLVFRAVTHLWLEVRITRQNALRSLFEVSERHSAGEPVTEKALREVRYWRGMQLHRALRRLEREDRVCRVLGGWRLTPDGHEEAQRMVRNHRLWELYLIHHAAVAPSHVDRDADLIEHVLGHEMVVELEKLLDATVAEPAVPESPHPIAAPVEEGGT